MDRMVAGGIRLQETFALFGLFARIIDTNSQLGTVLVFASLRKAQEPKVNAYLHIEGNTGGEATTCTYGHLTQLLTNALEAILNRALRDDPVSSHLFSCRECCSLADSWEPRGYGL